MACHPDQRKIDQRLDARAAAVYDMQGVLVVAGRIGGPRAEVAPFVHDPDRPTFLHPALYAEWRKSKCHPRDYAVAADRLADLDQATLELVGEVAEVGELIFGGVSLVAVAESNPTADDPAFLAKLADEIGDVVFCASWLGDAWGWNPLRDHPEFLADLFAVTVPPEGRGDFDQAEYLFAVASIAAGLLANSAKKVLCQGRTQPIDKQADRLCEVLKNAAILGAVFGIPLSACLARNVEKLDARFPAGHPLAGGGIRTGKGA